MIICCMKCVLSEFESCYEISCLNDICMKCILRKYEICMKACPVIWKKKVIWNFDELYDKCFKVVLILKFYCWHFCINLCDINEVFS